MGQFAVCVCIVPVVLPRLCAAGECLVITFMTQNWKANSNALHPPEKVKFSRMFAKLHRTGQLHVAFYLQFCDNLTFRIIFLKKFGNG